MSLARKDKKFDNFYVIVSCPPNRQLKGSSIKKFSIALTITSYTTPHYYPKYEI